MTRLYRNPLRRFRMNALRRKTHPGHPLKRHRVWSQYPLISEIWDRRLQFIRNGLQFQKHYLDLASTQVEAMANAMTEELSNLETATPYDASESTLGHTTATSLNPIISQLWIGRLKFVRSGLQFEKQYLDSARARVRAAENALTEELSNAGTTTPTTEPGKNDRWVFKKEHGLWYWKRFAPNGEKVGESEQGYKNKGDCEENAERNGWVPPPEASGEN